MLEKAYAYLEELNLKYPDFDVTTWIPPSDRPGFNLKEAWKTFGV